MKRHEWAFDFPVADVMRAAKKKADYHSQRALYWKSQLTSAEAQLHEQDAEGDAFDPTGTVGFSNNYGSIRDKAQARVVDVRGKMREHGGKVHEYRVWEELLARETDAMFTLHRDDVDYFDILAVTEPPESA